MRELLSFGSFTAVPGIPSCSKSIDVAGRLISLELPKSLRVFQNSLLFYTKLNGSFYKSVGVGTCGQRPPGRSGFRTGQERLITACGEDRSYLRDMGRGMPLLRHVQMFAIRPGTSFQAQTARVPMTLTCSGSRVESSGKLQNILIWLGLAVLVLLIVMLRMSMKYTAKS